MEILHHVRTQRRGVTHPIGAFRRAVCLIAGAVVIASCGGRDEQKIPTADTAVTGAAGDSAGAYRVPPPDSLKVDSAVSSPVWPEPTTILAADSVDGQRAYRRVASCIACHGRGGEGVSGLGSSLSDSEWKHGSGSLTFLYRVIRDGITETGSTGAVMPASRQLPSRDIFQIAAFVYALSHPGSTIADSTQLSVGAPPIAHAPPDTTLR